MILVERGFAGAPGGANAARKHAVTLAGFDVAPGGGTPAGAGS